MPLPPHALTGILLAGGRGLRMDGRDKGLVSVAGRPMAAWALDRLTPQVDRVLISANRHGPAYAAFGHPVVGDAVTGHAGPLAGLSAALALADTPWVITCPCDCPRPPRDLVARLEAARRRTGAPAAVAHDGTRLQPLFALLASALHPDLQEHLHRGGRRAGEWLLAQGAVMADFSHHPRAFDNINTEADRRHLEAVLRDPPASAAHHSQMPRVNPPPSAGDRPQPTPEPEASPPP
ncbi:molybdenum cofactor guanylyltransferase MobA [Ectothiorhodospira mobilis]|uniref:molybdenum cofactor guanylyltransferase MobA n=1 Tax=Ectothiorhodospira mobilis TaxID=195064 RepID=UPI0019030F97|nr:molybdenum cofactor guanylyltransferase MobA [Ectothiorhodospira mobilis]MBK1691935.1 molybdenum cofactor guanylyltransferase [Ectothiorhodospira mobilis]